MLSRLKILLLFFALLTIDGGGLVAQDFDPTKVKGDLQKIKKPLSKLFKLKSSNGRLVPEFEKDRQTAYTEVQSINTIGGNRGGGSSSSGSNWEIRINNNSFEGTANYGYSRVYPNPNPGTWRLKLKELKTPGRDLSISADEKGNVSVTLNGGDDAYLLRIRQQPTGSIFVQEVSETTIFSKTSASFDDFCRENSDFTQKRFLPVIRHLGIDAPMTQFDNEVQQSVVNFLQPIDDAELTSFQTSFKNLDSKDYAARKADSDKLAKGFEKWQDFIMRAVNDSNFPHETRFRMMKVMEKNAKPEAVKASRFAIAADLANNPQYLVWLYDLQKDENTRANILVALRKSTGIDLGENIAAWQKQFESTKTEVVKVSKEPPVDLLAESGALSSTNRYVGQLVKLQLKEDHLSLNRGHWAAQFDGKSIQQIVKETNSALAKLNMPANYDPDPLFELGSVSHPQAIFAKMRSEMQSKTKSSSVYYYSYNRTSSSSLNRDFANQDLKASMSFESSTSTPTRRTTSKNMNVKPPELKGKPFKLEILELKSPGRSLVVHEHADGRLRVALITEKSNSVVQILQKPEGEFVLQDVRGAEIYTAKAKTFSKFMGDNKDYCVAKLFPLFAHFGVSFDEKLFVPKPSVPSKTEGKKQTTPTTSSEKNSTIKKSAVLKKSAEAAAKRAAIGAQLQIVIPD